MSDHPVWRGSAIVVLFSGDLTQVAIGFCPEDNVWKFCGGTMSPSDKGDDRDTVARTCALRELYAEAGVHSSQLDFFTQVSTPREWRKRDRVTGDSVDLCQYAFVGVAKSDTDLPDDVEESAEISRQQWTDVRNVLSGAFLRRGHAEKFNPFHGIALAKAIILLRDTVGGDRRFRKFHELLHNLTVNGIYIDSYATEVMDAMNRQEI
jgi:8-oxo-dGTP pyrophosphatase MutT (NUDIX family)